MESKTALLSVPSFHDLYVAPSVDVTYPKDYDKTPVDPDYQPLFITPRNITSFASALKRFYQFMRLPYSWHGLTYEGVACAHWSVRAVATPHESIVPITPEFLKEYLEMSHSTWIWCVSMFFEAWAKEPDPIEVMKKMKLTSFSGAPINADVANQHHRQGVHLQGIYAATEFSCASKLTTETPEAGLEWFEFTDYAAPVLVSVPPGEENAFEVALKKTASHILSLTNGAIDGEAVYITSGLVEKHFQNAFFHRILGRVDDQITLSTGEKQIPDHWNFNEMIILGSPEKPFHLTGKLTLRRGAIIKDYSDQIDQLYCTVDETSDSNVTILINSYDGRGWDLQDTPRYVNDIVTELPLAAGRGIFPSDFVYQYPTVRLLATKLTTYSDHQLMKDLIMKYFQNWPTPFHPSDLKIERLDEALLITGTTGSIGSQILLQAIQLPSVKTVYAFNRPGKGSLIDRPLSAFENHGHDPAVLKSSKIVYVEAWKVNFNLSLQSFEPAIAGVRQFIDFSLVFPCTPRLVFLSSVSIAKAKYRIPETSLTDIDAATASGYGVGKWVAESILTRAAEATGIRPIIVRVGQISGRPNGYWHSKEWFPSLVQVSQRIGALPKKTVLSFAPLTAAAKAILEFRHSDNLFQHLVQPRPITRRTLSSYIGKALNISRISEKQWLENLQALSATKAQQPPISAIHLLDGQRKNKKSGSTSLHPESGVPMYPPPFPLPSPSLFSYLLFQQFLFPTLTHPLAETLLFVVSGDSTPKQRHPAFLYRLTQKLMP
ncbi:hypothetical protein M422DRAFT_266789 [Sphaerobolus stellatus SS14]|uniref:Thioester reductase (TE) domain-containing protein n=1 Tax=Sphaerobolus stellatus (strain SS14) TaxID=990650 RepID=A0A0C9V1T5_SPHS4|nr:hypothetical protein M422DRAFT_266789 [Sphaerobolus stellatus SS14]